MFLEASLLTLLIVVSGYLFNQQYGNQKNLKKAGEVRHKSYLLADQLRQSSDDLTRLVRTYAATGENQFENYFWEILDIRNGSKPRPNHYERVYWDFMTATPPSPPYKYGEAISLESLMRNAGFTEEEFELLRLSHQNSDQLVSLERKAMHAMKGKYQDEKGEFSITRDPNPQMAINILFGEEYHEAKKQIMEPINQFYEAIDRRTSEYVTQASRDAGYYFFLLVSVFALLIFIGFLLLGTIYFYQNVVTSKFHGHIDDLAREIEVRKRSEHQLSITTSQLENEKERLAVTLHSIGDGVISTDTKGNIVLFNKVSEQLTGWTQQEAVGKPVQEIFDIIDGRTGKPMENPASKVLDTGQMMTMTNPTVLISRDETHYSIEDSGAPIYDKMGNLAGVVLVFRDVTDELRTRSELQKSHKLESVGVLAGGIAHDFNNILTAIICNMELAQLDMDQSCTAHSLIGQSIKASLGAKDLTSQLLTFAKGGDPVRAFAPIGKIISDSANFVLRGSPVICYFNIPEKLWLAAVDIGQISQVVQNIIINARHAMPDGGVIEVGCENYLNHNKIVQLQDEKYVKITIADNGDGIPDEYLDKIFDPYFTTKDQGEIRGSGLGLSICHSIIRKHDGHIEVESEAGKGTTFTIYLPATGDRTERLRASTTHPIEAEQTATIMVMDDDEMILAIAKRILDQLGHKIIPVINGHQAIDTYNEYRQNKQAVDLIILDLTIPGGMGGADTAHEILKINPEAKIVVASGYFNDPVMARYKEYGFTASISKPFQLEELNKLINEVIQSPETG